MDEASITATSAAASLGASNLSDPIVQKSWRALSTSASFTAIFASETSVGVLALAGCTLSATDQIRHQLYDISDVEILDETVDADVVAGNALHAYILDAALTAKKWVCTITATSRGPEGFFDIGRGFAGPTWSPAIGIDYGWSRRRIDDVDRTRAAKSGAIYTGIGPRYRALSVTLSWLTEAESAQVDDFDYQTGRRGQIFLHPDDTLDPARHAILGHRSAMSPISQPTDAQPAFYSTSFDIEQDL